MLAILATIGAGLATCAGIIVLHEVGVAVCPHKRTWTDRLYEWMLSVLGV